MNTTNRVYGLFYKDHGNWRRVTSGVYTLPAASETKSRVKKTLKSRVIIRRVKFVK
jgi:hypothetical protein